jgi:hypothetical protein
MNQVVNLLAPGNPPSVIIGQATLTDLPTNRFPNDLQWLAPIIVVDETKKGDFGKSRFFVFVLQFTYGDQPTASYVEVTPKEVQGTFFSAVQEAG